MGHHDAAQCRMHCVGIARDKCIEGLPRNQLTMFPEALDDYISAESPVRFTPAQYIRDWVDAFVNTVDSEQLGFTHAVSEDTGRPPYHPADLTKLYLYGYLNRIRSSRGLEREAQRNIELMWLLRRLTPDFKTIADLRKDNLKPLRQVCRELELFGGELVAIDGSKFKAVNSKRRNFTENTLKVSLKKVDEKIDAYLQALDENDAAETDEHRPTTDELQEKIEYMRQRRAELQAIHPVPWVRGHGKMSSSRVARARSR